MSYATRLRPIGTAGLVILLLVVLPGWSEPPEGKKVALLIGVKQYKRSNQFPDLQYTENDVEKLATILRSGGFTTVRLLTTTRGSKKADAPTAANIRKELDALLADRSPRDTVLVALSGHGVALDVADPDGKGKNRTYSFFCPSDSDLVGVSYSTGMSKWLLNMDDLFARLGRCGAGAKLVLVDACRNELELKKEFSTRSLDARGVSIPTGVGALFSCSAGQYAHEAKRLRHGVFFHFVLKGLEGEARNSRNEVTWSRLIEYVTEKVSDESPKLLRIDIKQTPHPIGNLPGKSPVLIGPAKEAVVKEWSEEITNKIGMKLVRIKRGKFQMGSTPEERKAVLALLSNEKQMPEWLKAESPQHEVEITRGFWLGIHEVTQAQFKKVMGYNPSIYSIDASPRPGVKYVTARHSGRPGRGRSVLPAGANTSNYPVENVSWEEANEFCDKLSKLESGQGRRYRLPTEAEWEYACRAGARAHRIFHFGNSLSSAQANFNGTHSFGRADKGRWLERTRGVGRDHRPNDFGLYDMHGNVWEWSADWYATDYYQKQEPKDPQGPLSGTERVIRGGGWEIDGRFCRSASRSRSTPGTRRDYIGFRIVLVPASQ
jgi:formylglycine-generating enzyme required for sulfatase activity